MKSVCVEVADTERPSKAMGSRNGIPLKPLPKSPLQPVVSSARPERATVFHDAGAGRSPEPVPFPEATDRTVGAWLLYCDARLRTIEAAPAPRTGEGKCACPELHSRPDLARLDKVHLEYALACGACKSQDVLSVLSGTARKGLSEPQRRALHDAEQTTTLLRRAIAAGYLPEEWTRG